jgi:hypothetical protein
MMRLYYQDERVRITSTAVWVDGRRYRLRELERVWRQGLPVVGRRMLFGVILLLFALLAKTATGCGRWSEDGGDSGQSWMGAAIVGLLVLAAALLVVGVFGLLTSAVALRGIEDIRRYGRRLELWASVRGRPVLLVRTDDAIRYGRVRRALIRALNDRDDAAAARGPVQ